MIKKNPNTKYIFFVEKIYFEEKYFRKNTLEKIKTKFLSKAKQFGNQIENGKMMFIYQAQLAFKIWHNLLPKVDDKVLD